MSERFNFVIEPADAALAEWLRGQPGGNVSAVIRAALVEYRERPGQLARIEQKVDELLTMAKPLIVIDVKAMDKADHATLDEMLCKYGDREP